MDKVLYNPNYDNRNYRLIMAYPEKEEFALSSLGYMWLYKIADTLKGIDVRRASTDAAVFPFRNTDAVAFSLSFDFDFMGVFKILEGNHIPFLSAQRLEKAPLIFAGGPVITTNPCPYDEIFDFMIIGDGEELFPEVLEILERKEPKEVCLNNLAGLEGIYVPGKTKAVKKRTSSLNNVIYTPVLSERSYFKDTFIIELQRGCMNRCAFCTASYLNLPFRSYDYKKIIDTIDFGLKHTNKIALLGAQISAHPDFGEIIAYIQNRMEAGEDIKLGVSSLRADAISPELVKVLVSGGQETSTIAIEAGSERLRKFINKNISDEQIYHAVKVCRENGLRGLKIYSMIGIPTETQSDIESFVSLAKNLKAQNKGFEITFSFSSFVPKPHTPLQREKREETKELEKKKQFLEKELSKIGIGSKFSSAKWDYWQTLLSRGGSELGRFMIEVYKNGGSNSAYKSALKNQKIAYAKAIEGFCKNESLPWDFIENHVTPEILDSEYNRLQKYS